MPSLIPTEPESEKGIFLGCELVWNVPDQTTKCLFLILSFPWNSMKYVCTDRRKKGRKEGRRAEDKPFGLRKTEFCLYITTIPKDPWSFLLFNKKILCVWLSESLFLLWLLPVHLFFTYWLERTASAFSSSVADFTKGVILQGPILWGWVLWLFNFSVNVSCLSMHLYIF